MDSLKLVDKQDRKVLIEGRQHGLGFALCKREGDTIATVQPISPCKDYLNDVVYSEATGLNYQVWGLKTSKQGIFTDRVYLVIGICKKGGRDLIEYPGYAKDVKILDENRLAIQTFVNWFENRFGVPDAELSILAKLEDNRILCTAPLFWSKGTYLISLYGLLLRVGMFWDGSDVLTFVQTMKNEETPTMNTAMPKIKRMLAGEIPVQNFTQNFGVHNCGIVSYQFPIK